MFTLLAGWVSVVSPRGELLIEPLPHEDDPPDQDIEGENSTGLHHMRTVARLWSTARTGLDRMRLRCVLYAQSTSGQTTIAAAARSRRRPANCGICSSVV